MPGLQQIPEKLEGRRLTFAGGVHPPGHKDISAKHPIERAPLPPEIMLPVAMHVGAPAKPVVAKKDEVDIPLEYIKRIDRIIGTGMSIHLSREEFIRSAVQMKLANMKSVGSK